MSESTEKEELKVLKMDSSKIDSIKDHLNEVTSSAKVTTEHQDFNTTGYLLEHEHGEYIDKVLEQLDMSHAQIDRYEFDLVRGDGTGTRETVYIMEDNQNSVIAGSEDYLDIVSSRDYGSDSFLDEAYDFIRDTFGV